MRYKTRMSDLLNEMHIAESKKALDKKAKKSGMPKGILSKVYDRGMAAWKGGHRPGTTPQQWALARVNSFITKSSGTWGGADSDLAKQVRGRAEEVDHLEENKITKAKEIAKKMAGNMTGAVKEIEKMVRGLSKHPDVAAALRLANEELEEACWDSHKQVGTKMKGGKRVPNCVPKNEADNDGHTKSLAKDKDTGEPKKYVSGLSDKDKEAHKKHLDKNNKKSDDDKSAYKQSPADKKAKTKPSKHTKKFKQMYGEVKSAPPIPDNVKHLFDKDKNFKDKLSKFKFTKMVKAGQVKGVTPSMVDDLTEFTKKDFKNNENDNEHGLNAKKVVDMFGTSAEKIKIDAINARHNMKGHISREDQRTRDSLVSKYYNKLKEETINEFTSAQIKTLEREYAPLKGKTMSGEQIRKMSGMLKKYDKSMLQKLANASIPMLTTGAKSELVINRGMKWTDFKESLKIENADAETATPAKKKKGEDKDAVIDRLEKENQLLKVRNLEKSQKTVEPNRDTGEVPLKVGLAQKILKDMKDGKKVELPKKNKKEIKLDKKPTKVETKPTMDISPSAGGHDTEAPAKEK